MKLKRTLVCALGLSVALVAPAALTPSVDAAPQGASGQDDGQDGRADRRRGQRGERGERGQRGERPDAAPGAKVGEPAPDFTLKDTTGKEHKLSQYKGKIVVLQWINPQCPVCVRVTSSEVERDMIKELKAIDAEVVHLAINSTHFMEPTESAAYLKKHAIEIPALDDRSGGVGKLYNAKRTPHMYVIDGDGVLRYNGAIDNDRAGNKGEDRINYVVNAVRAIKAGETVSPDMTESYGCSVKYAPDAAPAAGDNPGRRGPGGDAEGRRGRRGGGAMSEEMLKRFDKDGDGELNEEERQNARETMRAEMLEKYDTDGDGELNDEEREKMREDMRRQRGGGGGQRGGGGGGGGA